jgi:hypothetical protein
MTDREGFNYTRPGTEAWGLFTLISPARQSQKALGLSGRQRRKLRKAIRRQRKSLAGEPQP